MAGLESIPLEIYEAAEVDGASRRAKFFSIMLPLLKPAIFVALMFRTADAFKAFDTILMITRGGPAGSTEMLTLWIYKVAFSHLELGTTSAASYILMLILLPPVLILTRLLTGKEGLSALLRR